MKRSEVKRIKSELDNLEKDTPTGLQRIDKRSTHFVVPLVLFYFVVGLLLILLNELVTDIAAWALAAGLVVIGGWLIFRYFRSDTETRLTGADLAIGLVLLLAGVLQIQYAFDEKSVNVQRWWIMLIFAAVSLATGILALLNKSVFGDNQHLVIGIFMICEAVLDLATWLLIERGLKKKNAAVTPAAAYVPNAPAETVPQPEEAKE